MLAAILDAQGTVTNIIVADPAEVPGSIPGEGLGIGWIRKGDKYVAPPAPPAPIVVPLSVTMRQARLALLSAGVLQHVDTILDALPEPDRSEAKIAWEYAAEVERHSTLTAMLGASLGLDDASIDQLFVAAAAL